MANIGRTVRRVRQTTKEKMGYAEKSELAEEQSIARERFQALKVSLEQIEHASKSLVDHLTDMADSGTELADQLRRYGLEMLNSPGAVNESEGVFGKALIAISDVQESLDDLQEELADQIEDLLMAPTKNVLQQDLKQFPKLQRSEDAARIEFDAQKNKLSTFQTSNIGPTKMKKQEENVSSAKIDYENKKKLFRERLNYVGCNTQAKEICHLRNLLDAQLHYFANAYTKLTEQEEFLAELEEYIGKNSSVSTKIESEE